MSGLKRGFSFLLAAFLALSLTAAAAANEGRDEAAPEGRPKIGVSGAALPLPDGQEAATGRGSVQALTPGSTEPEASAPDGERESAPEAASPETATPAPAEAPAAPARSGTGTVKLLLPAALALCAAAILLLVKKNRHK